MGNKYFYISLVVILFAVLIVAIGINFTKKDYTGKIINSEEIGVRIDELEDGIYNIELVSTFDSRRNEIECSLYDELGNWINDYSSEWGCSVLDNGQYSCAFILYAMTDCNALDCTGKTMTCRAQQGQSIEITNIVDGFTAGLTIPLHVGILAINATIVGANVYLDEVFKGLTPAISGTSKPNYLTIDSVPIGKHIIKLTKTGYTDYTEEAKIYNGLTTIVSSGLSAIGNGTLKIIFTHEGLSSPSFIYFDNQRYTGALYSGASGSTEIFNILPGTKQMKILNVNMLDFVKTITLTSSGITNVQYNPISNKPTLHVYSTTKDATIYTDNNGDGIEDSCARISNPTNNNPAIYNGYCYYTSNGIKSIRISKQGYQDFVTTANIRNGTIKMLPVELEPI